ncbi:hypothetical protein HDA40_004255 [Hamadaea flava]|uniref:Glycerophosphoryl diester phosphodiesterase membrane domain-containing protein n=1 Tax=Hamadaea flava TaxID=1742688 RepID=A0ABV8M1Q6_9ACTN|nr:hypothetical protein [Hamadaea flava]MCP2325748.1 hypothetical protein [Hamadaea flava]
MTELPPPSDYLPPPAAYQAPGQQYPNPYDPLVNPPYAGIGGWFGRMSSVFQRSWKSIAAVFAITHLLPSIVLAVVSAVGTAAVLVPWQQEVLDAAESGENPRFDTLLGPFLGLMGALVVAAVLFTVVEAAGYAAGTYVVTRDAAGAPTSVGDALRYGFRRCLGLFGWNLLTALLIIAGAVACVLPAFYVLAATALVGPIYLFERRTPIGRSFTIFNNNLGRVLGRLAMILVILIGGSIVTSTVENVLNLAFGGLGSFSADPGSSVQLAGQTGLSMAGSAVVAGVGAVIGLPFTMIQFVGILLTYAEQRGHEGPVSAGSLAAELD